MKKLYNYSLVLLLIAMQSYSLQGMLVRTIKGCRPTATSKRLITANSKNIKVTKIVEIPAMLPQTWWQRLLKIEKKPNPEHSLALIEQRKAAEQKDQLLCQEQKYENLKAAFQLILEIEATELLEELYIDALQKKIESNSPANIARLQQIWDISRKPMKEAEVIRELLGYIAPSYAKTLTVKITDYTSIQPEENKNFCENDFNRRKNDLLILKRQILAELREFDMKKNNINE